MVRPLTFSLNDMQFNNLMNLDDGHNKQYPNIHRRPLSNGLTALTGRVMWIYVQTTTLKLLAEDKFS